MCDRVYDLIKISESWNEVCRGISVMKLLVCCRVENSIGTKIRGRFYGFLAEAENGEGRCPVSETTKQKKN